jgi:hypothetical protein
LPLRDRSVFYYSTGAAGDLARLYEVEAAQHLPGAAA